MITIFAFIILMLCCTQTRAQEFENPILPESFKLDICEDFLTAKGQFDEDMTVRTNLDWKQLADSITQSCKTQAEKSLAIYNFICDTIAYDTDYKIYHVDECWKKKKGVCQAYSELYFCIAKAAGVNCHMVFGDAKHYDGSGSGHAWIMTEIEKGWILLDPTWGAGYVNGGVYTPRDDHESWYDVDPYWMFFSHNPRNKDKLLTESKYSDKDFKKLPGLKPLSKYGYSGRKVMEALLTGKLKSLPHFYDLDSRVNFKIKKIPQTSQLQAGTTYTFSFKPEADSKWAVISGSDWYMDWVIDNNGLWQMEVTPKSSGTLKLAVQKPGSDRLFYSTAIQYEVKE